MVFTRFVEIGRVAMINYGPDTGKLCTVIDVVDSRRAHVDGPFSVTGVRRQMINLKRLQLTDIKVTIPLRAREGTIKKAFEKEAVLEKFNNSALGRKLARQSKRANLSDFDRFKVMIARKQKAAAVKKELRKMKKSA